MDRNTIVETLFTIAALTLWAIPVAAITLAFAR